MMADTKRQERAHDRKIRPRTLRSKPRALKAGLHWVGRALRLLLETESKPQRPVSRDPEPEALQNAPISSRQPSNEVFDAAVTPQALSEAWGRVRRNGGASGGDGMTAQAFARGIDARLETLSRNVRNGRYRPGPLRSVEIPKSGGRVRELRIPSLADRVVQTAVQRRLSAELDRRMSAESFGYRPSRSVTHALDRARRLARDHLWVLDADIRSFFDEVAHDRLLDDLSIWLDDPRLIDLMALWLDSFGQDRGLAQGAPISPLLANIFLHPLDADLCRRGIPHVRYADDFIAFAPTRRAAQRARDVAARGLARRGLVLHPEKTRVAPLSEGVPFLGSVVKIERSVRK